MVRTISTSAALVLALAFHAQAQEKWDKDVGKPAPRLFAGGWVGTPVSLDALRRSDANPAESSEGTVAKKAEISGGNTVVLAFWNADIPC